MLLTHTKVLAKVFLNYADSLQCYITFIIFERRNGRKKKNYDKAQVFASLGNIKNLLFFLVPLHRDRS